MKEFESWKEEHHGPGTFYYLRDDLDLAEEAWKAALEWMCGQIKGNEGGYEIYDKLMEELEND